MSLFFGGGAKTKPQFTGLAAQTSSSSAVITTMWGMNRVAPNIIWQGDFKSKKMKKQGKGGGGKGGAQYTYSASFQLALCWGEATGIGAIWKDTSKVTALKGVSYATFLGTTPQDPWGYLTTKHPDEALGYPGIVHIDLANYDLGQSNTLGQHSFEVKGPRYGTAPNGMDADPALIVEDFMIEPNFGVGFDMDVIVNLYSTPDAATTGDSAYQTYCRAMGFGLSPILADQQPATDALKRWADLTNTAICWNGYQLKFFPYGAEEVTGNGVTYIPNFPLRYDLTDNDFLCEKNDDPIKFDRIDPADAFNSMSLIISNRANEYNELPVPWQDQGLIDEYGLRKDENYPAKDITEISMAEEVVTLIGQRKAYIRNTFKFTLPQNFCRLEPMDVVRCTDRVFGTFYALIQSVEEDENDNLSITADEYHGSLSLPARNIGQSVSNTPKNTAVDPGPVNPPLIFEPPALLTGGAPQIWAAVSGGNGAVANENWGGAIVYISTDDVTYIRIGETDAATRMGLLSAALPAYAGTNPDVTNTLKVNLAMSAGELEDEASPDDAAAGQNLAYVDGEYISFEEPNLTASFAYDLEKLYRGMYGSTIGLHNAGTGFAYLDDSIFKYELPPEYIGKMIYMKFQSFNVFEEGTEDLSDVIAYTYTPSGKGYGTGPGGTPSSTGGISGSGGSGYNRVTWQPNTANDSISSYEIWRAVGTAQPFSSATKIDTVGPTSVSYTDVTATPDQAYTYFVVPVNAAGTGTPSTGVTNTSSPTGGIVWKANAVGTGAAQNITLPYSGVDENGVFVYVNGLRYATSEYSITGTTLTLTTNATGDTVEIIGIVQ